MAEKIGLSAVLETKEFQRGLATYLAGIGKMQGQTAGAGASVSTSLSGVNSAILKVSQTASSSASSVGGFASALGGMATVAGGIVVAGLFEKIASGVSAFVSVGLEAVGQAQKLEAGLGALLTQNNLYERTTKEVTVAVAGFAEAQADAAGKADDLAFKQEKLRAQIEKQTASIQEQRQRIIQMSEGLNKNEAVAQLGVMETALKGLERELEKAGTAQSKLLNIQQEYATATVTSYEQVNDFATAQKLATEQTQQLLAFVDKLSIISPFESEQVALVTKFAVGAGLAVDETKAFTAGFLDLAAAVGIGSEELAFASDQLLQVAKIGKITTIDLRQLRRLGIDLEKIIGVQMGMSIDEFNAKAEKSPDIFNDLFNEVAKFSSKTFPGAAKKLATSLDGIGSTFSDIFKISSKNLLRPLVDAAGPAMSEFLGRISDIATGPQLAAIGANIPKVLFGAFKSLSGEGEGDFFSGLKGLGLSSSLAKDITDITAGIRELFDSFKAGGVAGLAGALGIPPETAMLIGNVSLSIGELTNSAMELITGLSEAGGLGLAGLLFSGVSPEAISAITNEIERLAGIFNTGFASGGMGGGLSAVFDNLKAGISEALPGLAQELLLGIPAALGVVATGIGDYLTTALPLIRETMREWAPVFWEWTNDVINGIGVSLGAVILAIGAWVTSPEGQGQMSEIGRSLGIHIIEGLKFIGENTDDFLIVAGKIAAGLALAVAAIAGELIVIGATVVAGMMAGILESLGIDLQPATIGEMQTILNQIADDALTIAKIVGTRIIIGIIRGFKETVSKLSELMEMITDPVSKLTDTISGKVKPVLDDLSEEVLPPLAKGLEIIGEAIQRVKGLFNDFASAVSGFKVPDILVPGSPPPLAYALFDVATGAEQAGAALKGMMAAAMAAGGGGNLFGDMLNFGDEGHLKSRGFSDTRARNIKAAYRSALTELWDEITAGTAGALDLEALTKKNAGDWGQFVEGADIAFGTVVERIRTAGAEMAEVARREIMDKMLNMASGFASFGDFLTDMLTTQRAAVTETIDSISRLAAENLKLGESLTTQEQKLAILNQELSDLAKDQEQDATSRERRIQILKAEMEELLSAETKDTIAIEKKQLAIDNLTNTEDVHTLAIEKKQQAIAALTKEIDTNRAAMEANQAAMQASQKALEQMAFDEGAKGEEARIKLLQDFLESKGKELVINKELTDEEKARGITAYHLTYDRKAAQAELNELLRKQREEQEAIAALEKSKADLAFLQQQVAILQLIKDNGLKVGDIFKDGIKFGLGASASDLMTATSAVIEAMISQINDDLQVASPSKRLTRIFKYAMEGAAIGIEKGQSMLSSAVKATPLLQAVVNPQMVRQPISGRAGNNTTNNYNFPMTVSTAATAEGVVRQYEVKKSMYAAA